VAPRGERAAPPRPAEKGSRRVGIHRARGDRVIEADDEVAVEEPLEIRVGRAEDRGAAPRSVSVTMRTPGHDFELAVGFLFTEGIVRSRDAIASVEYGRAHLQGPSENVVDVILARGVTYDLAKSERNFYTTSACGVCGKASLEAIRVLGVRRAREGTPQVAAEVLARLPERLREGQRLFRSTGGLHAAGRFDPSGRLVSLHEDVGRHNAVDKLVGECVLAGRVPLEEDVLAVSGRASFEILQKAAVAGIPIVVAVGAPSSLAVDLAREYGMTLVGFAREEGFNIYAGKDRIAPTALARSRA
jgi:FdhD protein